MAEDDPDAGEGRPPGRRRRSLRQVVLGGLGDSAGGLDPALRRMLGDMRLPKEAVAFLLQQAERSRREVTGLVGRELRGVLARVDWAREARRLLGGMRLQIRAEVRLVPRRPRKKASTLRPPRPEGKGTS